MNESPIPTPPDEPAPPPAPAPDNGGEETVPPEQGGSIEDQ